MKNLFLPILLVTSFTFSYGQRFYSTVFDQLPQSYQLYPRNEKNEASVPIKGRIELEGWSYFSLKVFRNKTFIGYQKAPITYKGAIGTFSFLPTTIKAEKAEYDFKIYAVKGKDSLELVVRENIVAGDVYVLTGQSNSTAFFAETRTNEFCRTFGKITGTYNIEAYNPADTLWTLSNQEVYFKNVGALGYEFQKYILDNFGIPTCLVSAGFHWSSTLQHATRTPWNPADLNNGYGRMLYRLQKAGIDKAVKGFIFRQGETEGYGEGSDFGGNFDKLYKHLKLDLPSIKQLYVYQIDIINPAVGEAPKVRETQRALVDKYPDLQVVASIGTKGFDGLHYTPEGYAQNATELGKLVARDFYNATDKDNIDAPNIRKAYFSKADKSEITLSFPVGQELTWNEKTRNLLMKDFFYLDGVAGNVQSGSSNVNKIVLKLNNASNATKISYLPAHIEPTSPDYPYTGPYITNKKGLRALSFYEVPLDTMPALTSMTAVAIGVYKIKLSWKSVADAVNYVLEREEMATGVYQQIAKLDSKVLTFVDSTLLHNKQYNYRIKVIYPYIESNYANVSAKTNDLLSTPTPSLSVVYFNELKLSWNTIPKATYYVIERKTGTEIFNITLDASTTAFSDKNLKPNTNYTYTIQAFGDLTESLPNSVQVKTPTLLDTPMPTAIALTYNSLKISWNAIADAKQYVLEKKIAGEEFKLLTTLETGLLSFTDTSVEPNILYTYRIKALGKLTESLFNTVENKISAFIQAPVLRTDSLAHNFVKIAWASIPNAVSYILEKKLAETGSYVELAKLEASKAGFADTQLKEKTTYYYRLKAISNYSESAYSSMLTATTIAILATEEESVLNFKLSPNPANTILKIEFPQSMSGQITVIDFKGAKLLEESIKQRNDYTIDISALQKGMYVLVFNNQLTKFSQKFLVE